MSHEIFLPDMKCCLKFRASARNCDDIGTIVALTFHRNIAENLPPSKYRSILSSKFALITFAQYCRCDDLISLCMLFKSQKLVPPKKIWVVFFIRCIVYPNLAHFLLAMETLKTSSARINTRYYNLLKWLVGSWLSFKQK